MLKRCAKLTAETKWEAEKTKYNIIEPSLIIGIVFAFIGMMFGLLAMTTPVPNQQLLVSAVAIIVFGGIFIGYHVVRVFTSGKH